MRTINSKLFEKTYLCPDERAITLVFLKVVNYLDILICIPIAYGAWIGFRKGLIIEVCTLLALLLGIWGGIKFSDAVAAVLRDDAGMTTEYLPAIAFTVTFLLVGAMVFFAGKAIERFVSLVQMKLVNKIFGLVFGSLKYVFLISIALVILESYDDKSEFLPAKMKEDSVLFQPMKDISLKTIPALQHSDLFNKSVRDGGDAGEVLSFEVL